MPRWEELALCAQQNPAPGFFWPWKETEETDAQVADFCSRCPSRLECFKVSMTRPEVHFYWGGVSSQTRAQWRRERRPFLCVDCGDTLDPARISRYKERTLRRCNTCLS